MTRYEPGEYLQVVLPALLRGSKVPPPQPELIIQFLLSDRDDCDCFYRVTSEEIEVTHGLSERVDLTMAFYSQDLAGLYEHKADLGRSVRTGRIKVMGSSEAMHWLVRRLSV